MEGRPNETRMGSMEYNAKGFPMQLGPGCNDGGVGVHVCRNGATR